ncbi:MAG TPA: HAMP domain-containing sensor histidine kinase [Anaerolineae bacterium]|nr:HAMP domain-containing sensor histidine kinase [Anaerolineae bacterium]
MSETDSGSKPPNGFRERLFNSRFLGWLMNLPPIAWLTRQSARYWFNRRTQSRPTLVATVERAAASSLEATLQGIVQDVVNVLGYTGAMVATYEQGDSLPVRAIYIDPHIARAEDIHQWERNISEFAGRPVSITDPDVARVYVYDEACADNLSVKAVMGGGPITSEDLYDLFTPIAPLASRPFVEGIQQAMGIQQVIAVPFFLEVNDGTGNNPNHELVGNLFAAKRARISTQDIMVLSAFGRQAAAAIGSERRRLQIEIANELIFRVQTSLKDEARILEWIVQGVVTDLGYAGAMVAPYEADGSLPAYALHIDPRIATLEDIHRWEDQISQVAARMIRITDPSVAKVYVDQEEYRENLSFRAAKAGKPVISNDLYDLFTPIVPPAARGIVREIQQAMGIQQVIAVPFFLEKFADYKTTTDAEEGPPATLELVGNLFAATRSQVFKRSEIDLLQAFGVQAAAGIRNARLYRKAEERQQAAQMFGRMAFSAATSVHAMRNHVGVVRLHLDLLERMPLEEVSAQLQHNDQIKERLDQVTRILDTLREPWRQISDELTDVNTCLSHAINRTVSEADREHTVIKLALADSALKVETSADMLTEAFKVLIKNAFEAIREKWGAPPRGVGETGPGGRLYVQSRLDSLTRIEVLISDNGGGIKPENVNRIFEIGWSTKKVGMGFGLFWAKDYFEGLGGSITVESVLNQGTTFVVRIPCRVEHIID